MAKKYMTQDGRICDASDPEAAYVYNPATAKRGKREERQQFGGTKERAAGAAKKGAAKKSSGSSGADE